jgi:hypothetical protein
MNDSPDKPAASEPPVHPGEIALLLITRSRTKSLAEVFASLKANTVRKDKTLLWAYVDDDDEPTLEGYGAGYSLRIVRDVSTSLDMTEIWE